MANSFGTESRKNLEGVHPTLVAILEEVVKVLDCKVVDGVRTPEEQAINLARGVSWTKQSKHLPQADGFSHAVDIAPIGVKGLDWEDREMFCVLAGVMFAIAAEMKVKLRWGGDWNMNNSTRDERNRDYGHFEIYE